MKNIKRICMAIMVMALSVAMLIGTVGISAMALTARNPVEVLSKNATVNIVDKVKYGGTFIVPAGENGSTAKVTAPDGLDITDKLEKGEVTADQVGNYTVTYTDADETYSYDFTVKCYVEEDYSLEVKYNGADIPTYAQVGSEITLPKAELVYYDEDGKRDVADATVKVKASDGNVYEADGKDKVKLSSSGKLFLTYSAQLGSGKKYYTEDFTVLVQDKFSDEGTGSAPTLSIVNVSRTASLNRKVTLPKAEANDNFDKNPKVVVKVTVNGKAVTEVDVNEDGYAYLEKDREYNAVEFDNDKVMSFYPTENAKYYVTYQAFDDAGNASGEHSYEITVSDTTAPIFKDIAEDKIPSKWGINVNDDYSNIINFPVPTVVDNAGSDNLTVSFKITDPDGNTVVNFTNINSDTDTGKKISGSSNYGETSDSYEFITEGENAGFAYDPDLVKTSAKTGDFTVEYGARDAKGNRSTKTYKINIAQDFEDTKKPNSAEIIDAPTYISITGAAGESFVVPAIDTSDESDSRPKVDYVLTSTADAGKTLKVSGGEKLDIVEEESKFYLVNADGDDKIEIAANQKVNLTLTVTDKTGNSAEKTAELSVFSYKTQNDKLALDVSGFNLANVPAKEKVKLGKFTITVGSSEFRKFTGYELSVKDPDNNYLTEVSSEYYYDADENENENKIVVRNIEFTPSKVGKYQITVRAFDLSGKNIVSVSLLEVESGSGDVTSTAAATLPSNGNINASYSFRNETIPVVGEGKYYAVYTIVGSKHSVMGTEFTAMTAGSYVITESYAEVNEKGELSALTVYEPAYTVSFTDSESPVLEIQGPMPKYSAKSTTKAVVLPSMVVYSANGNGAVSVTVRHEKSSSITKVTYNEATNEYSFLPEKDGVYKVHITGTVNNKTVDKEYSISVGDIVAPSFTLDSEHNTTEVVGAPFTFKEIKAEAGEGETLNNFTFTKKLLDPSGDVVSEATINGVGTSYAAKPAKDDNTEIKLSKSGTYRVIYEVTDENGNTTTYESRITVSSKTGGTKVSVVAIGTVLTIVGVLLIVAVIVYFVLFRKRKAKNN